MAPMKRNVAGLSTDDGSDDAIDDADNDAARERTIESAQRSLLLLMKAVARNWERCGKAACTRSRRCRGFACERKGFDE